MSRHVLVLNLSSRCIDPTAGLRRSISGAATRSGSPRSASRLWRSRPQTSIPANSATAAGESLSVKTSVRREPSGLAIDRKHARLFSTGANKTLVILDATTGKVVKTLPIGGGVDAAGFDPEMGLAFSSNGDGTLTVIREDSRDKFTVVENVTTQRGARTLALDTKAHRVYLVTAEFGPPPAPTPERPRPRPSIVPGSFTLMVVGR